MTIDALRVPDVRLQMLQMYQRNHFEQQHLLLQHQQQLLASESQFATQCMQHQSRRYQQEALLFSRAQERHERQHDAFLRELIAAGIVPAGLPQPLPTSAQDSELADLRRRHEEEAAQERYRAEAAEAQYRDAEAERQRLLQEVEELRQGREQQLKRTLRQAKQEKDRAQREARGSQTAQDQAVAVARREEEERARLAHESERKAAEQREAALQQQLARAEKAARAVDADRAEALNESRLPTTAATGLSKEPSASPPRASSTFEIKSWPSDGTRS